MADRQLSRSEKSLSRGTMFEQWGTVVFTPRPPLQPRLCRLLRRDFNESSVDHPAFTGLVDPIQQVVDIERSWLGLWG
jgi:hypothetical protein